MTALSVEWHWFLLFPRWEWKNTISPFFQNRSVSVLEWNTGINLRLFNRRNWSFVALLCVVQLFNRFCIKLLLNLFLKLSFWSNSSPITNFCKGQNHDCLHYNYNFQYLLVFQKWCVWIKNQVSLDLIFLCTGNYGAIKKSW